MGSYACIVAGAAFALLSGGTSVQGLGQVEANSVGATLRHGRSLQQLTPTITAAVGSLEQGGQNVGGQVSNALGLAPGNGLGNTINNALGNNPTAATPGLAPAPGIATATALAPSDGSPGLAPAVASAPQIAPQPVVAAVVPATTAGVGGVLATQAVSPDMATSAIAAAPGSVVAGSAAAPDVDGAAPSPAFAPDALAPLATAPAPGPDSVVPAVIPVVVPVTSGSNADSPAPGAAAGAAVPGAELSPSLAVGGVEAASPDASAAASSGAVIVATPFPTSSNSLVAGALAPNAAITPTASGASQQAISGVVAIGAGLLLAAIV